MKVWITVGIVAAMLAGIGFMQLIGGINPMRSSRPGWECDATRGGAVICVKDVKQPPHSK